MSPTASELASVYGNWEYLKTLAPDRPKAPVDGCECAHCRYARGEEISNAYSSDGKCMHAKPDRYWRGDYERARKVVDAFENALSGVVPERTESERDYLPTLTQPLLDVLRKIIDEARCVEKDGVHCRFCMRTTHDGDMSSSYASGHIPCTVPCSACSQMRRDDERLREYEEREAERLTKELESKEVDQ